MGVRIWLWVTGGWGCGSIGRGNCLMTEWGLQCRKINFKILSMSEIDKYLDSVSFTKAVVGFLKEKGSDRICLIVRKRVLAGLGKDLIAGIGGKVGDEAEFEDETVDEAMDRETMEEVKVRVIKKRQMGKVRFIFTHKQPDSTWNQEVTVFLIDEWKGEPAETESAKPLWFKVNEIPWARMWADQRRWVPKVLAGEQVKAIFLFTGDNEVEEWRFEGK